jgi:hypothetical protein
MLLGVAYASEASIYSTSSEKVKRNCHFSVPGRNCVTHRQAQTAVIAKIIYKTVYLSDIVLSTG